ncbi:hypothetical protein C0Q70_07032 [Pomacea canaliculata]|uniref:Uncharacterized protein n=1 Tax=Pomacea canaliculata TaxID=400727 RepID=A0A2T7PDX5_POMCA|nr:hypothetical protein C0Q70_07032 [Pomacea canaliculata]
MSLMADSGTGGRPDDDLQSADCVVVTPTTGTCERRLKIDPLMSYYRAQQGCPQEALEYRHLLPARHQRPQSPGCPDVLLQEGSTTPSFPAGTTTTTSQHGWSGLDSMTRDGSRGVSSGDLLSRGNSDGPQTEKKNGEGETSSLRPL